MKNGKGAYHVFEMGIRDRKSPTRQVNRQPLELKAAKDLARIGATEGKRDRAVTTNPRSRQGFEVIAQYEAKTGENVTGEVYYGRQRRPKVLSRNPVEATEVPADMTENVSPDAELSPGAES